MGWFDFFFNKKKKAPPEQLVLGAKLHCPYCLYDACSYLWVDTKTLDINDVPLASVDDCVPLHNIPSFGLCNMGGGTCDVCMKFDGPWENREPQGLLASGKEALTMDSILSCSHGVGAHLKIVSSGQDHLFVSQLIFMKEMDKKYPGLREILEDPGGSLYLNEGMYQMALQFLGDRINADGGAVSLYILDNQDDPEAYYVRSALGHLEPAVNANSLHTFVDGFNAIMGKYDDATRMTIDDHSLNGAMLNLLKQDCDDNNKWIQKDGFYRWQEEHKGDLALLADWMRGAVSCSMMAAIVIASGPGASAGAVKESGWSEEIENVKVEGGSGTKEIHNPVLDNPRTGSALKGDAQHAFNDIIDNYAGDATKFNIIGGDGVERSLYQIEGSLNGKQGVFEWIVDPVKGVTHRRYIEDVGVTGIPNARP